MNILVFLVKGGEGRGRGERREGEGRGERREGEGRGGKNIVSVRYCSYKNNGIILVINIINYFY